MSNDKLAKLKANLDRARLDRKIPPKLKHEPVVTRPLRADEAKSDGWQSKLASARGAGYLQAEETAQFPTPLIMNWPMHLRNDLYEWTWANRKTGEHAETIHTLLEKLDTRDVKKILDSLESFKSEDLTSIGAIFYRGLLEEEERRLPSKGEATKVRVSHVEHEEHEEHEVLAETVEPKRMKS